MKFVSVYELRNKMMKKQRKTSCILAFEYKKWHTDTYSLKSHSLLFQGIPAKNVVYVSERLYYHHLYVYTEESVVHTQEVSYSLKKMFFFC